VGRWRGRSAGRTSTRTTRGRTVTLTPRLPAAASRESTEVAVEAW